MRSTPYRTPAKRLEHDAVKVESCPDRDLVPVFTLLWGASMFRVAVALSATRVVDTGTALAAIALVVIPLAMRRTILWGLRRLLGWR